MFNESFDWVQTRYVGTVGMVLNGSDCLGHLRYADFRDPGAVQDHSGSFLPEEDQGYLLIVPVPTDGASLNGGLKS